MQKIFVDLKKQFSQEFKFLLTCLTMQEPADLTKYDAKEMDWGYFLDLCIRHKILPLVSRNLTDLSLQIPDNIKQKIKNHELRNRIKQKLLMQTLVSLTSILKEKGILSVPLKGPALSQKLFGSPDMRMSKDLDIMVCEADFEKAYSVLLQEGLKPYTDFHTFTNTKKRIYIASKHDLSFWHPVKKCEVELHLRPFLFQKTSMFPFSSDDVVKGAVEMKVDDQKISSINFEHQFTYLLFHAAQHSWHRMMWLLDLHQYVNGISDWNVIIKKHEKYDLHIPLLQMLLLRNLLFEAPIPPMDLKYSSLLTGILKEISPIILSMDDGRFKPPKGRFRLLRRGSEVLKLKQNLSFWEKIAIYTGSVLRPSLAIERYNLPPRLSYLYYFLPVLVWIEDRMRGVK